jgi:hypothetical protein
MIEGCLQWEKKVQQVSRMAMQLGVTLPEDCSTRPVAEETGTSGAKVGMARSMQVCRPKLYNTSVMGSVNWV